MKLISVLIPTRRRPELLAQAVESVLRQTYARDCTEIIIVHDGEDSIGTNVPYCNGYAEIPKGGLSAAVNQAFSMSRGQYITVLADDDMMAQEKLETLARVLDTRIDCTAAYALGERVDATGMKRLGVPPRNVKWLHEHPVVTWQTVINGDGCLIHGTAMLHRRAAWEAAGLWDIRLWAGEEWEYNLRLLHNGGMFAAVPSVTDLYRVHAGQKSSIEQRRRSVQRRALLSSISKKYLALARP
jgi:glycosyltransferase involved in cell wall biosynthesis